MRDHVIFDKSDGPSLRSGFLRSAAAYPNRPAVIARGVVRTYAELEDSARRWANAILSASDSEPKRIGLLTYRSEVAYIGTLSSIFSGAAFVPLNATFPAEKNAAMARQAELDALVVDRSCAELSSAVFAQAPVPLILAPEYDGLQFAGIDARVIAHDELQRTPPLSKLPPLTGEDIAYILFTSGSTGAPKGVPVTHSNAAYFMEIMTPMYAFRPEDRFSQTFDQTFDLSVFDMFMAWWCGACAYAMSPVELLAPIGYINKNQITVWFSVPSVPAHMLRRNTLTPGSMPTLRWSLFAGEPLPRRSVEAWLAAAPHSELENLYGPTEATIACLAHRWNNATSPAVCQNDMVPIGRPFPGHGVLVVDDHLNPVSPNEVGELCINGPQVSPGYWRDPQKTAERYPMLSVSSAESRRFYRTGDRVARLPEGEYMFIGRADHQIKVLGHRVELGEIEVALRKDPAVEHAVALGWPPAGPSYEAVVAYVSGDTVDLDRLSTSAKAELPPYSVPKQVFLLQDMPLNANGKVDRQALKRRLDESEGGQASGPE